MIIPVAQEDHQLRGGLFHRTEGTGVGQLLTVLFRQTAATHAQHAAGQVFLVHVQQVEVPAQVVGGLHISDGVVDRPVALHHGAGDGHAVNADAKAGGVKALVAADLPKRLGVGLEGDAVRHALEIAALGEAAFTGEILKGQRERVSFSREGVQNGEGVVRPLVHG